MEISPRHHVTIPLPARAITPQPRGRVRRITVAPRGHSPVDALVATPEDPQGLTLHFVGFNTAMGPWEAAKCALWASISRTIVVTCELPGFSRYGHHLPTRVRQDLLDGDPSSWASATLACLKAVVDVGKVPVPEQVDVLAFSTGCSLAVASLPALQASYPVSRLTLVEPVSLTSRTIGRLAVHNVIDLIRLVKNVPRNYPTSWVRQAHLRQFREPRIRFSLADFLASVTMLASDDTGVRLVSPTGIPSDKPDEASRDINRRAPLLDGMGLPVTHLARGSHSKLCPQPQFTALDAHLADKAVSGTTCTIVGLGHQWWHCLPALDAFTRTLYSTDSG